MTAIDPVVENPILVINPMALPGATLVDILRQANFSVVKSTNLRQAFARLNESAVSVVICESELSDGTWKDAWAHLNEYLPPPSLIVTSHCSDERLWAEVLNLGGFDVLAQPFDLDEVTRVVSAAVRANSPTARRLAARS